MTPEQEALAQQLVALPDWTYPAGLWLADGRVVLDDDTVEDEDGSTRFLTLANYEHVFTVRNSGAGWVWTWEDAMYGGTQEDDGEPALPDLAHDANGGILLGMLPPQRGAVDDEPCAYRIGRHWRVRYGGLHAGETLAEAVAKAYLPHRAEALIRALEAAP